MEFLVSTTKPILDSFYVSQSSFYDDMLKSSQASGRKGGES